MPVPTRDRFNLEPLEPRVLLSADMPLMEGPAANAGQGAMAAETVGLLHSFDRAPDSLAHQLACIAR